MANRFGLSDRLIETVRNVCNEKVAAKEELKGDQHKLDVAEPKGKLTSADFKKLQTSKEQVNVKPDLPEGRVNDEDDEGWYAHREIHGSKGISRQDWQKGWRMNSKGQRVKMKEEVEQVEEAVTRKHFQQVADVIKSHPDADERAKLAKHHASIFKAQNPRFDHNRFYAAANAQVDEEVEQVDEREMTSAEMKKREEIVKSMKKNFAGFKERYGKRGKDVMYATATKQAMKEED